MLVGERTHAHERARKQTLCNLAYCNNKKESYYGFFPYIYIHIHSVNLVKLADGKPVPVHVFGSTVLCNNQCAREVFLHGPGDAQKNVGEEESRMIIDG